jgi:membrane protease YdiL (CAAX protease family)
MSVVIAAFVEELVYRVIAPSRIAAAMRRSGLSRGRSRFVAGLFAQVLFSLSHILAAPPGSPGIPPEELLRLFVSGTFYLALVGSGGFWLAAAMHALSNADVGNAVGGAVAMPTLLALTPIGLLVTWLRARAIAPVLLVNRKSLTRRRYV